jgi:hypothetical protein
MTDFIISDEQEEIFNDWVKCLCALLKATGQEEIDVIPDTIYLDKNGKWTVQYGVSPRRPLLSLEGILLHFSCSTDTPDNKTQEELFDILIQYMEIDENYLRLFLDE